MTQDRERKYPAESGGALQMMAGRGVILGIESSCDETAAAIVVRGQRTLSNIVASQIATHARYGGVVPELASREHLRNIVPVVRAALAEAGLALKDLDAIAVTEGPGLAGALLVGITYAKSLAFALGKPLIAINHLEGHIHAVLLEQAQLASPENDLAIDAVKGPALALVVSGGHTHLYLARTSPDTTQKMPHEASPETTAAVHASASRIWSYQNVGRTVDDAAGEAFDKVAKLLGLGYPGGPWIDALAPHGNPRAVPFSFAQIKPKAHRPGERAALPQFLFSFSGIKTAVLRYVELHSLKPAIEARRAALAALPNQRLSDALPVALKLCDAQTLNLIASFQRAVVGDLLRKTFLAAETLGAHSVLVSGGVAANRELRVRFTAEAAERGLPIGFPSMALSTDNAAMIAAAAWPKLLARDFAPATLSADPNLGLGGSDKELAVR